MSLVGRHNSHDIQPRGWIARTTRRPQQALSPRRAIVAVYATCVPCKKESATRAPARGAKNRPPKITKLKKTILRRNARTKSAHINEQERGKPPTMQAAQPAVRFGAIVLKRLRGDKEANFRRAEPLIR